jgi:hypothetical protein
MSRKRTLTPEMYKQAADAHWDKIYKALSKIDPPDRIALIGEAMTRCNNADQNLMWHEEKQRAELEWVRDREQYCEELMGQLRGDKDDAVDLLKNQKK